MRHTDAHRGLIGILVFMACGLICAAVAWAAPPIPYSPWGTVTINGVRATDWVIVEARIGGVSYATTHTTGGGWYALDVVGDDPDSAAKDGGAPGDTVLFYVAGYLATPSGTWTSGANTRLDLAVSIPGWVPPATPTPTLTPAPTPTATPQTVTLLGRVSLQARPTPPAIPWVVALRVQVGATTYTTWSDASGRFVLVDVPGGPQQITVKNAHTISNRIASVVLLPGPNDLDLGTLWEGDANDDDVVDITDFSILRLVFATADGRADFNQDGIVDILDFSLLRSNFAKHGPLLLRAPR